MEKAIILITLKLEYSSNLVNQLKNIKGVSDAALIYGPYDAYTTVQAKTKEDLRNIVMQIRQLYGVFNTLTCTVVP
jgi:hypothetical protein